MIRGYKIRIYPSKAQESIIWNHIHASRFIWNYMLAAQEDNYKNGGKFISAFAMNKMLTPLKKKEEYSWLNGISTATLQHRCTDLAVAYKRFFNGAGYPHYKSRKKSKNSYSVRCENIYFTGDYIRIEKLDKVKYKSDYKFAEGKNLKFHNARISYKDNKYFLSFSIECENQAHKLTDDNMGIDLGIKELAVVACGNIQLKFNNINKSKKVRLLNERAKKIQHDVARKYETNKKRTGKYEKSNNIIREENKLRRIYAKIANIRYNYIHQTTRKLVNMFPKRVVMEDLNVMGMMKNRYLSRAVQEQCFYEFIRQMRYKCEWSGIEFIQADRFFPSSKTCSCCGAVKKKLKLSERTYVCSECGLVIDRDYNAAINLMKYMTNE